MNTKSLTVALMCFLLTSAAHAQSIKNAVPEVARPLPLSAVRVTGGPLKRAQDLNAEYLLKLERTLLHRTLDFVCNNQRRQRHRELTSRDRTL